MLLGLVGHGSGLWLLRFYVGCVLAFVGAVRLGVGGGQIGCSQCVDVSRLSCMLHPEGQTAVLEACGKHAVMHGDAEEGVSAGVFHVEGTATKMTVL